LLGIYDATPQTDGVATTAFDARADRCFSHYLGDNGPSYFALDGCCGQASLLWLHRASCHSMNVVAARELSLIGGAAVPKMFEKVTREKSGISSLPGQHVGAPL
jgi:hypothetical protein